MALVVLNFSSDVPIFQQIVDNLEVLILTREIKEGEFLPSVRDFAVSHSVNPNTVGKSYKILQDMGLVENVRGLGLRVTKVKEALVNKRTKELIIDRAEVLVKLAKSLHVPTEELIEIIKRVVKEKDL
jgi:GntR family transcriptional regulator